MRLDPKKIPRIGSKLAFTRPKQTRDKFERSRDDLNPNVKGTVIGIGLLGTTFHVNWENAVTNKTHQSWIGLSELEIMGLGEPLQVNQTPTWTDIRALIDGYTNVTEENWKNTRVLCKQLKGRIDEKSEIERSLGLLTLPSVKVVGPNEYASQAICQVLDSQFLLSIRSRYTALDSHDTDQLTPKDHEIIFRHLVISHSPTSVL
jgi:hypothetical protein